MFQKDPEKRVSMAGIAGHDWVTCNGIKPMQIKLYKPLVLNTVDFEQAISKVSTIELISIRMKRKV